MGTISSSKLFNVNGCDKVVELNRIFITGYLLPKNKLYQSCSVCHAELYKVEENGNIFYSIFKNLPSMITLQIL